MDIKDAVTFTLKSYTWDDLELQELYFECNRCKKTRSHTIEDGGAYFKLICNSCELTTQIINDKK